MGGYLLVGTVPVAASAGGWSLCGVGGVNSLNPSSWSH